MGSHKSAAILAVMRCREAGWGVCYPCCEKTADFARTMAAWCVLAGMCAKLRYCSTSLQYMYYIEYSYYCLLYDLSNVT